jgi:hypothetical protein
MKTGEYHIVLGSGFKGRHLSSRIPAQNRKRRKKLFWCVQLMNGSALRPTRMWSHKGGELGFSVCPARHGPTSGWDFSSAKVGQHLRRMYCWAAVSTHSSQQQQHGTSVAIAVVAVVVLLHVLSLVLELPVTSL